MTGLVAAVLAVPLVLATLLAVPGRLRAAATALAPWAALPAVALAVPAVLSIHVSDAPQTRLDLPWLLLGSTFGIDDTGSVFLLLTGLLWLLAGLYARAYLATDAARTRYFAYHLFTLAGNLGVVLAHDVVSFYLSFLVMTLAAFGLIIHRGTTAARRASLVYLVMAVAAEGLLLFGFVVTAHEIGGVGLPALLPAGQGHDVGGNASLMLLLGFGVKAGLPLLHMWLPLAHPVAPTPASAVLSGAMIKAGLLGWLRFLPLGEGAEPLLGTSMVIAGLVAAFYGAVLGVTQRQPKALLAYSSVSQMGFLTVAVGAALALPEVWPAARTAVLVFAFHHAMTKGALFLGVGIVQRQERWRQRLLPLVGMAFAGAVLTGLPFTGGALAKSLLKNALHPLAEQVSWASPLPFLVTLAAAGTGLLMLRLLALLLRRAEEEEEEPAPSRATAGMWLPWLGSLAAVAAGPVLLASLLGVPLYGFDDLAVSGGSASGEGIAIEGVAKAWELLWPALLAAAAYPVLLRGAVPELPAGDVLVPLERVTVRLAAATAARTSRVAGALERLRTSWNAQRRRLGSGQWLPSLERNLMRWDSAGVLLLLLGALLTAVLMGGRDGS
ncbi:MAG: complex I subunit 5 family protein [Trueperaceae bacterium]